MEKDISNQITQAPKITVEEAVEEYKKEVTTSMRNIKPGNMAQHFAEWVDKDLTALDNSRKEQLKEYAKQNGGRIKFHLFRLLSDDRRASNVENDFALAFLDFSEEYLKELRKEDDKKLETLGDDDYFESLKEKVTSILGAESFDSTMFWTFAPYLYKNLKAKNISDADCVKMIMKWALTGNVGTSNDDSPKRSINLKGLEELPSIYYLTKNPNGATHLFTDKEAKKIVNEVLLKED